MKIEDRIIDLGLLEVAIPDIQSLSHDDYALARKDFFGASDSSILLGVNLYKDIPALIQEKRNKTITKEEREVGEKAVVRKGYDLEPFILDKAQEELGTEIYKPQDMFRFKAVDGLSLNYDGVSEINGRLIPIEAKLVSKYGEKYYNKLITNELAKQVSMQKEGNTIQDHIKRKANKLGIPPYYYTQVQQEIFGLDAPYGYLIAMFDESWTHKLYLIPRDDLVIQAIQDACKEHINKIREN